MYLTIAGFTPDQTKQTVSDVAKEHGVRAEFNGAPKGKAIAFVLRPNGAQYRRLSAPHYDGKQRKVNAVCWHGHEAVMRALFLRYGGRGVKIESNMAGGRVVYVSLGDFDASKYDAYEMNVGSRMNPAEYGSLCECED